MSHLDDIEKQEEDIFDQLSEYENQENHVYKVRCNVAKCKAMQQLAVSADSPFSREPPGIPSINATQKNQRQERAGFLRDETDQIWRQLSLVKDRLDELKKQNNGNQRPASDGRPATDREIEPSPKRQISSSETRPKEPICHIGARREISGVKPRQPEPKFRPLTGKTDCPNCTCDRRTSVCDQCIKLPAIDFGPASKPPVTKRVSYDDDRPIRPAKDRTLASVEVVDDKIVPGKVYTISKALNEKRTKLAQAIDELQSMMDQVKESGDRLSRDRKLVRLYKDQWKYGPSIGGPAASSRDRLGQVQQRRGYESRLDPNLSRDSKSVSGFGHIESAMRLRQYEPSKFAPRTKKFALPSSADASKTRSKSLESLAKPSTKIINQPRKLMSNFHNGKSSSENDLSKSVSLEANDKLVETGEDEVDEDEQLELDANELDVPTGSQPATPEVVENDNKQSPTVDSKITKGSGKVERMTWIPVFGETEIKTVKRVSPTRRKIQVVSSSSHTNNKSPTRSIIKNSATHKSNSLTPNSDYPQTKAKEKPCDLSNDNRVLGEAKRKLRFASDLLEQEKQDSSNRNQLVVQKTQPVPCPRRTVSSANKMSPNISASEASSHTVDKSQRDNEVPSVRVVDFQLAKSNEEIARLEEMINEQQRLLTRLVQSQERQQMVVSPLAVHCPNSCCLPGGLVTKSKSSTVGGSLNRLTTHNRSMISSMRDRLNKTKIRLARTLESEREKHQRLKLQVDSSLRKQSDLEHENEMLKQSLSKCIDTCLKDIANTFEILNETLTESFNKEQQQQNHQQTDDEEDETRSINDSKLTDAAQLITDNRRILQMRNHIENIERQRKSIFDELSREKQKSNQLESQLRENQAELNNLLKAKSKLESRSMLENGDDQQSQASTADSFPLSSVDTKTTDCQPSTSKHTSQSKEADKVSLTDTTDLDDSYNSVELYRSYIQSISPDIESIRRERKMILSEFDNIKKMLSDLDK